MGFGLLYWQNYLFWLLKYVKVLYGSLGLYDCFLSKDKKKAIYLYVCALQYEYISNSYGIWFQDIK